ncbi:MAG: hypothetical protein WKG07_31000 [Hymenobacter sp.]
MERCGAAHPIGCRHAAGRPPRSLPPPRRSARRLPPTSSYSPAFWSRWVRPSAKAT